MSTYQQNVQRQAARRSLTLTGQSEAPILRGLFLACNVLIFGAVTTIPWLLGMLAIIGSVLLFVGRA